MQMKGGEIKTHNKEKSLLELLYDLNLFKKAFGYKTKTTIPSQLPSH